MTEEHDSAVQLGRLIESIENLKIEVAALRQEMACVKTFLNKGKGAFWAFGIVSGGFGTLLTLFVYKVLG
jgi:hypothetical protein